MCVWLRVCSCDCRLNKVKYTYLVQVTKNISFEITMTPALRKEHARWNLKLWQTNWLPTEQLSNRPTVRQTDMRGHRVGKFHFRERKELGCEFGFLNSTFYREIPYWNVFLRLLEMIWRYFLLRSSHCVCGTMMPSFRCGILENIIALAIVCAELWYQASDSAF